MENLLASVSIGEALKIKGERSILYLFTDPAVGVPRLGYFISQILPNIYIFAGVILFFLLIGGGLMVIVGAGQQNPEKAAKGKQAITAALFGFLIIFASYWIIQIIEIVAGIKIFKSGV